MEKNKELTIVVAGQTATGKSRVLYVMKEYLSSMGFEVEFDGGIDHNDEEEFDTHMSRNVKEALSYLKHNVKITLKEVQTLHQPISK